MDIFDFNIYSLFPSQPNYTLDYDKNNSNIPCFISNFLFRVINHEYSDFCFLWDNSVFKFKKAIKSYYKCYNKVEWSKEVWHKEYSLRYFAFVWLALNNGLNTVDNLICRNINISTTCYLCYYQQENINHLYFECVYSFNIIKNLIHVINNFLLRPNIFQIIQHIKDLDHSSALQRRKFYLYLDASIYYIWIERNKRRFENNFSSQDSLICIIEVGEF